MRTPGNGPVGPRLTGSLGCRSQPLGHRVAESQRGLMGTQGADSKSWADGDPGSKPQPRGRMGGRDTLGTKDANRDEGHQQGPRGTPGEANPNSPAEAYPRSRRQPQVRMGARDQGAGARPQCSGQRGHQWAHVPPTVAAGRGPWGCSGPHRADPSPGALGSRDTPGHITHRD